MVDQSDTISLNDIAEFSWNFNSEFLLETAKGNFVWSDPDHRGDNTISPFNGSLQDYCKSQGIPYVRDKGKHVIRNYCGPDVIFV